MSEAESCLLEVCWGWLVLSAKDDEMERIGEVRLAE